MREKQVKEKKMILIIEKVEGSDFWMYIEKI